MTRPKDELLSEIEELHTHIDFIEAENEALKKQVKEARQECIEEINAKYGGVLVPSDKTAGFFMCLSSYLDSLTESGKEKK